VFALVGAPIPLGPEVQHTGQLAAKARARASLVER
jgi:hypothetical protein